MDASDADRNTHEEHGAIDYAHTNREYFDKIADTYDEKPFFAEVAGMIGRAFLKEYDFSEEKTRALDFACGTGLVSRELAPHTNQIVGVDISQGMVDQYNQRVSNQSISPEEMRAICVDLKGAESELDGQKFDVVVCSMAYHHFESIQDITRKLVFFLKPGGALLVADLIKGEKQTLIGRGISDAAHKHVVPHQGGFDEVTLRSVFEEAGLEGFTFTPRVRVAKGENEMNIFIAKGLKRHNSVES
ncbi:hypothetical protein ACEPAF_9872 [Sanghuangporus sanghuang]